MSLSEPKSRSDAQAVKNVKKLGQHTSLSKCAGQDISGTINEDIAGSAEACSFPFHLPLSEAFSTLFRHGIPFSEHGSLDLAW